MTTYKKFLSTKIIQTANVAIPAISEALLIYFIAYCYSVLNLKYSTIKLYLCGIRHFYVTKGISCPLYTVSGAPNTRIMMFLKSVKRNQSKETKTRLPIDDKVLRQLCCALRKGCFNNHDDALMMACLTVGFFGFLRCGEFTVNNSYDDTVNLGIEDISLLDNRFILHLKGSKNDPYRQGKDLMIFATENELCPKQALINYLHKRAELSITNSALFIDSQGLPLSRRYFIHLLRLLLQRLGFNDKLFSGHSLRKGSATTCGRLLIEDSLIRELGRWNSDTYNVYIKTDFQSIRKAHLAMARGVPISDVDM